jgi:hypothetical protein
MATETSATKEWSEFAKSEVPNSWLSVEDS